MSASGMASSPVSASSKTVHYDVNTLVISDLDDKATRAIQLSNGAITTRAAFLEITAEAFASRIVKGDDLYLPRAECLARVRDHLWSQSSKNPAVVIKDATWKHQIKSNYNLGGPNCDIVYSNKRDPQSEACITPLEDAYNILLAAHVDPKTGAHVGRDKTFSAVKLVSESITKDLAAKFVARCHHQKCSRAIKTGQTSGVAREAAQKQLNPAPRKEKQSEEDRKATAIAGRVAKKQRREEYTKVTKRAIERVLSQHPEALQPQYSPPAPVAQDNNSYRNGNEKGQDVHYPIDPALQAFGSFLHEPTHTPVAQNTNDDDDDIWMQDYSPYGPVSESPLDAVPVAQQNTSNTFQEASDLEKARELKDAQDFIELGFLPNDFQLLKDFLRENDSEKLMEQQAPESGNVAEEARDLEIAPEPEKVEVAHAQVSSAEKQLLVDPNEYFIRDQEYIDDEHHPFSLPPFDPASVPARVPSLDTQDHMESRFHELLNWNE